MNVLAIGCHPDDLEIACSGTLARMAKEGHNVYMVHVANGDMGHAIIMPPELRDMREQEAIKAGLMVGAKKVYNIDIGDCVLGRDFQEGLRRLVGVIREVQPDFIITHNPEDYMQDHVEVSKMAFEASFTASVPHMFPEFPNAAAVVPIYYMDTLAGHGFEPELYVDITDEIDLKLEALKCHESQIKWMLEHDKIDFVEWVQSISRFRGLQSGVQYAEGFRVCKAHSRVTCKRLLP